MIVRAIKAAGLVFCVFMLEWITLYWVFKGGFSDYDVDFTASLIAAICASVITVFLFRRLAPPRHTR